MPLFPNTETSYYDDNDRNVLSRMENFYSDAVMLNQQFWAEADVDVRFYCCDQTVWNDVYGNVNPYRQRQFSFNRIRRTVEMVGGYQRRNRKSTIAVPIENSSQLTADQFTKILMWSNQQEGVLETISESFTGALITGLNLLHVWMDYREDPISGNIKVTNSSYNSFLIDPYFRKHDLSDCNAIWKRSWVTKSIALSLLPDKYEEIASLYGSANKDGKFQYMPESYDYNMRNLLPYDEFYYRSFRKQKLLVDTENGGSMEWKGDESSLRHYLSMFPQITVIEQDVPTCRLAIVVQGKVMYDGPNPMGIDDYPFVPVLGYYTPELPYFQWRIQGMVRGLRDAQYLYNRRKVIELDILESQVNSGWLAKENAFVDPKTPYKTGQGQVLWLKEDANMTDVQQIPPAQISPSMFQLSEQLAREVQEISGVNEELLGSALDDKAGILSMLRQGAGLTTLQRLFDQLDMSQKLLGKLMIKLVQANFSPGKVERIIHEKPSDEFYNKNFGKYDATIEEGFNTTTQRQMQFAQLLQLREAGVPVPSEILIETATLQNKDKLIQAIQATEQQQSQLQQAQAQSALQEQQATLQMAQARAAADYGLAQERASRVEENKALAVERTAEALKDEEMALLNKVKMIKELQDIDINQLQKLLILADQLKKQEKESVAENAMLFNQLSRLQEQQPIMEQPPMMGQEIDRG